MPVKLLRAVCVLEGTELMRVYLCESREAASG